MRPRWLVASGVGLAQLLAFGTTYYLLTVLGRPIHEDTGWPLTFVYGGMSAGMLAGAVFAPRIGRWIRSHGGKPALSLSSLLFATGLGTIALSPSLPVYFAGWVVIGFAMPAGLYDAAFGTLGRLYGLDARRAITTVTLWGRLCEHHLLAPVGPSGGDGGLAGCMRRVRGDAPADRASNLPLPAAGGREG